MKINYEKFIADNFMVIDRETQVPVPFSFNQVQKKYMEILANQYKGMEGVREIILKARQQGFSTLILALFTVDFLLRPYSVSICISHRKDATELLFKKVKFFIESYLRKLAEKKVMEVQPNLSEFEKTLEVEKLYQTFYKELFKSDTKGLIENGVNHSLFYIQTAGTKVGGRGGSARNIHFSEAAFYQDTDMITAEEIIISTTQQVPQGRGMVFIESTANGEGNYYQEEWERAHKFDKHGDRESIYRPQFFGWQEFYTKEWVMQKRKEFATDKVWKQEYPADPEEAFITSGTPYFDVEYLNDLLNEKHTPTEYGRILPDGNF